MEWTRFKYNLKELKQIANEAKNCGWLSNEQRDRAAEALTMIVELEDLIRDDEIEHFLVIQEFSKIPAS